MRTTFMMMCIGLLALSCKNEANAEAIEAFEKNSQTVLANLEGWQNENLDYSVYADDFAMMETAFGAEKDSMNLEEMKVADKMMWETYDFEMLEDPVLLPGVNQDTKMADGSVRHYSQWRIIKPATDSTEAKSGLIRLYESFDFDENGKIRYQQVYGDFTGIMTYLNNGE
ncbi:MAG: hypothetical protein HKP38_08540 [Croceitalea sp.]|nr:hypothetical protein [Croceitalea sp.]MBT8238619.1 hypothetical protein [Croceitalea sp.]NNL09255.1 hypothetical protein [Croceitalea sp.]NNM19038.1 hypothetical protein [Croceitalea sp.]